MTRPGDRAQPDSTTRRADDEPQPWTRVPGAAFLLSQVGAQSSGLWTRRLAGLRLDPRHVLVLRQIATVEGQSQEALRRRLDIPASRMVAIVDELERRRLVRRQVPADRRVRALHLTATGRRALDRVRQVSARHEEEICRGLTAEQREQLIALLTIIVTEQGLPVGGHPDA